MSLVTLVVAAVALAACITDVRRRRIPNALTFGAAAAALLFHALNGGVPDLQRAALGWLVGAGVYLPFFLLRGMGGGDVKLMAAIGAWLGPAAAFLAAMYALLAGGVMGLGLALGHGYLRTALRNVKTMLVTWWYVGLRPVEGVTLEDSRGPRLAFALPVCVGTFVVLWVAR